MNTPSINCLSEGASQRGYVKVEIAQLSYLQWGTAGTPLVLLHGITSSARTWWQVAPRLVARGYHVYAFDMPGHGESNAIEIHAIDNIAGLIAKALQSLGLNRPIVIGHSWGGAVALELATLAPLARLALVDPLLRVASAWGAARLPFYLDGVGLPQQETLPQIRANNPDWHACDIYWKSEALEQCRANAVTGLFTGSGDWDITKHIARISMPLMLMVADPQHTIIAPDTLATAQESLRPGLGKSVEIQGTTHNMFRGSGFHPFMDALLPWLE